MCPPPHPALDNTLGSALRTGVSGSRSRGTRGGRTAQAAAPPGLAGRHARAALGRCLLPRPLSRAWPPLLHPLAGETVWARRHARPGHAAALGTRPPTWIVQQVGAHHHLVAAAAAQRRVWRKPVQLAHARGRLHVAREA